MSFTHMSFAMPAPPATMSAPVVLDVLAVVLVPVIVVNRPLAAVVAPTVAPLIVPPVIATDDASCVAIVPRPSVVRWAAASASSRIALPAAVQVISSISPAPAVERPSSRSVALTF